MPLCRARVRDKLQPAALVRADFVRDISQPVTIKPRSASDDLDRQSQTSRLKDQPHIVSDGESQASIASSADAVNHLARAPPKDPPGKPLPSPLVVHRPPSPLGSMPADRRPSSPAISPHSRRKINEREIVFPSPKKRKTRHCDDAEHDNNDFNDINDSIDTDTHRLRSSIDQHVVISTHHDDEATPRRQDGQQSASEPTRHRTELVDISGAELQALDYLIYPTTDGMTFAPQPQLRRALSLDWLPRLDATSPNMTTSQRGTSAETPDSYAVYYPNETYRKLHTILHDSMVETAKYTVLTRQGTPVPQRTENVPNQLETGSRATCLDATDVEEVGFLTPLREAELWRNYLGEISDWVRTSIFAFEAPPEPELTLLPPFSSICSTMTTISNASSRPWPARPTICDILSWLCPHDKLS